MVDTAQSNGIILRVTDGAKGLSFYDIIKVRSLQKALDVKKRLYLKVGDRVRHIKYSVWGTGEVTEEKHSCLSGGCCLVRILFEDGNERSFINDMDNECCCYYSGVRILH